MRVINAGIVLIVIVIGFFATDNLRLGRIRQMLFGRANTNVNMDVIATDVLDEAIEGIDEKGEVVFSVKKADVAYTWLVGINLKEVAEDGTAFMVYVDNEEPDGEYREMLEKAISAQIKNVNKRLSYSFLFTEQTNSFLYNPTCKSSVYIMYLPRFANMIRLTGDGVVYTLSGAKLE